MHRGTALTLGVACCVLLSSCQSDDAEPGARGSTEPTETSASTPTATKQPPPSPTPPEMPALASQKSTAGAKAFVAYYIDVLNYGYSTAEPAMLSENATASCLVCQALYQDILQLAKDGGRQVGGDWSQTSVDRLPEDTSGKSAFVVGVHTSLGRLWKSASAQPSLIEANDGFYEFHLTWHERGWLLSDLRIT